MNLSQGHLGALGDRLGSTSGDYFDDQGGMGRGSGFDMGDGQDSNPQSTYTLSHTFIHTHIHSHTLTDTFTLSSHTLTRKTTFFVKCSECSGFEEMDGPLCIFPIWGPHPTMLRSGSWLWPQELLLGGSWDHMEC